MPDCGASFFLSFTVGRVRVCVNAIRLHIVGSPKSTSVSLTNLTRPKRSYERSRLRSCRSGRSITVWIRNLFCGWKMRSLRGTECRTKIGWKSWSSGLRSGYDHDAVCSSRSYLQASAAWNHTATATCTDPAAQERGIPNCSCRAFLIPATVLFHKGPSSAFTSKPLNPEPCSAAAWNVLTSLRS